MQREETAYEALGVPYVVTQSKLARPYRKRTLQCHPNEAGTHGGSFLPSNRYKRVKDNEERRMWDTDLVREGLLHPSALEEPSTSVRYGTSGQHAERPQYGAANFRSNYDSDKQASRKLTSEPRNPSVDTPSPLIPLHETSQMLRPEAQRPPNVANEQNSAAQTPNAYPSLPSLLRCARNQWLLLSIVIIVLFLAGNIPTTQSRHGGIISQINFGKRTHYQVLNVHSEASPGQIKKSYHALISKLHPDKTGNSAATNQVFQEVREAYELLSDPIERCIYDNSRALTGDRKKHIACATAKLEIEGARWKQEREEFLADQQAAQWKWEWREAMRNAEVKSLIPIFRETTSSMAVVIKGAYRRVGGRLRVFADILIIRAKLLLGF